MGEHAGRRYAIVGGTAGMGMAAARELAAAGGRVALIGRDAAKAQAIAATLAADTGADVIGDGADPSGLGDVIARVADRLGGLNGLAVTAGPINSYGSILELSDDDWAESFDTQLMTVVRTVRAAIPIMAAGGGGSIVTTAAYSTRAQKLILPHYAAMKSAIIGVTKNVAKHFGNQGIRANCIAPGTIATEALDAAKAEAVTLYEGTPNAALARFMTDRWGMKVALDRVGEPREVGELIGFLLSTRAAYMTGAILNIDGGTDF